MIAATRASSICRRYVASRSRPSYSLVVVGQGRFRDAERVREGVQQHGADEAVAVAEAPVQGADADAGPPGDLVERRVEPAFQEQVARRDQHLLVVATGVGAHATQPTAPSGRSSSV